MGPTPHDLPTLKLLLLGPASSGKTALLLRHTSSLFDPDTTTATIGVDFRSCLYAPPSLPGAFSSSTTTSSSSSYSSSVQPTHRLLIFDTAGQDRFRSLTSSYYRGAQGALLVYDITNRQSFLQLDSWLEELRAYADGDVKVWVVGCKKDREERGRAVGRSEVETWVRDRGCEGCGECSAKTGEGVGEVFEGLVESVIRGGTQEGKKKGVDVTGGGGMTEGCAC